MIGMRAIEYRVTDHDQRFFMRVCEDAGQRVMVQLDDFVFPDPLPELILRRPVLVFVVTDDAGGAFSFFTFDFRGVNFRFH